MGVLGNRRGGAPGSSLVRGNVTIRAETGTNVERLGKRVTKIFACNAIGLRQKSTFLGHLGYAGETADKTRGRRRRHARSVTVIHI